MGYGRKKWFAGAIAGVITGVVAVLAVFNWATVSKWACEFDHSVRATFGMTEKHQFVEDARQDPTCDTEGFIHYSCMGCDEEKQETLPMLEHTPIEGDNGVEPTCTDRGLSDGMICADCGAVLGQEEIPALGHNEMTIKGYSATCKDNGLTDGSKCARCNEILVEQEEIPATGHEYIDDRCVNCGLATVSSLWTLPASEGYTVDGNELTFAGTHELTFATKEIYNSITLTFNVSETQDVRGAFQIGWGAQSQNASINDLPFVQFNYDRAVLVLPDGTTYDTSWLTGESWKLTIDAENNKVILSVDGEVVYNVDASWWTQEGWGLPGYLILRAESNCALTLDLMEMMPN